MKTNDILEDLMTTVKKAQRDALVEAIEGIVERIEQTERILDNGHDIYINCRCKTWQALWEKRQALWVKMNAYYAAINEVNKVIDKIK